MFVNMEALDAYIERNLIKEGTKRAVIAAEYFDNDRDELKVSGDLDSLIVLVSDIIAGIAHNSKMKLPFLLTTIAETSTIILKEVHE